MMDRLAALIARHEGRVLNQAGRHIVYKDSLGYDTIGYGRLLSRGLSEDEARHLLANDVADHRNELLVHLPWAQALDEVRRAVLVDMAFNLGVPGLLGFRRMLAAVRARDWETAAREMLDSRWAGQVGHRAEELAKMMTTGEWPEEV